MPVIYMGWFVQCDNCAENDTGDMRGDNRNEAIQRALKDGWIRDGKRWFCSEDCQKQLPQLGGK